MKKFDTTPIIVTERCLIRPLTMNDRNEIFRLKSDPRNLRYLEQFPYVSISQADVLIERLKQGIINSQWLFWAINRINGKDLIGTICLWNYSLYGKAAEVGYELLNEEQGKGLMTEALSAITEFGIQKLGLKIIQAYTRQDNQPSIRLLARCGYKRISHDGTHDHQEVYAYYSK